MPRRLQPLVGRDVIEASPNATTGLDATLPRVQQMILHFLPRTESMVILSSNKRTARKSSRSPSTAAACCVHNCTFPTRKGKTPGERSKVPSLARRPPTVRLTDAFSAAAIGPKAKNSGTVGLQPSTATEHNQHIEVKYYMNQRRTISAGTSTS